jgi:hypothetical protein
MPAVNNLRAVLQSQHEIKENIVFVMLNNAAANVLAECVM